MPRTVVLETLQTYHAIFRAVNPSASWQKREHRLHLHENREQTRNMPLQEAFITESARRSRNKAPERSIS